MKIRDIISKEVISCKSDSSIYEVAKLMKENNIGFIPIVDDEIMGVITDRDIVVKCVFNKDECIKSYITSNVISIDEDEDVISALDLMGKKKVKRLIVTKEDKLVGILSISDILNSEIDNDKLIDTLKTIYELKDNKINDNAEIDEFYL